MLVTEDEARTIRCPLSYGARFTNPNGAEVITVEGHPSSGGPGYSHAVMAAPSFCIASKCMAWRWQTSKRKGYCGMAGGV